MKQSMHLTDYELLDMANGEKLERWGKYILIRPDPQIMWKEKQFPDLWKDAHARYIRSTTGGGYWEKLKKMDDSWKISYRDITFNLKPMGFKHTGLFPEQSVNWDYMIDVISKQTQKGKEIKILNLFAYTGGASVACLSAGACVCHVDSSQGIVAWAKENVKSSKLQDKQIRFIIDDVKKFVKREIRRGSIYDGIILDPPSYGRGKNGEVWNIDTDLYELLSDCVALLSKNPLFLIVNTYTGGFSGEIVKDMLTVLMGNGNKIVTEEIGLSMKNSTLLLPCGITTKFTNNP